MSEGNGRGAVPRGVDPDCRLRSWSVYLDLGILDGPAGTVELEPRVASVLRYLVENRGRVVSKDELQREVWEGMAVEDSAIVRAVVELRKALGDDSKAPVFLKTLPRRGYVLVAEVESARRGVPRRPAVALAVALGIVLVAAMLLLRSRSDVALRGPDSSTGADMSDADSAVEEASAAFEVALINGAEPGAAWAELSRAYAMLSARAEADPELSSAAYELAKTALERSPGHPDAHASLGLALYLGGRLPESLAAYEAALELAPDDPVIVAELIRVLVDRGTWPDAIGRLGSLGSIESRAAALTVARALVALGLHGEARRVLPNEGRGVEEAFIEAVIDLKEGRYADAAAGLAVGRNDPACPLCPNLEMRSLLLAGRTTEADEAIDSALRELGSDAPLYVFLGRRLLRASSADPSGAVVDAGLERAEREILSRIDRGSLDPLDRRRLAQIAVARDDFESAAHWYEESVRAGWRRVEWDRVDPYLEPLREHPGFLDRTASIAARNAELRSTWRQGASRSAELPFKSLNHSSNPT